MFNDPLINKMVDFIRAIGIDIQKSVINDHTDLPGIKMNHGTLVIDEEKLKFPGDILHKAGHLAVIPSSERKKENRDDCKEPSEEMMAMAWSYAAAVNINIPPEIVFHEFGYKGQSQQLIYGYQSGYCPGLPMLQWAGMCYDYVRAPQAGVAPFPNMIKWLRD